MSDPASVTVEVAVDRAFRLLRSSLQIADRAVIADIESECVAEHIGAQRWYDTRPMLSPDEHCAEVIDMMRQSLDYAVGRGLVQVHDEAPHLVRVLID